MKSNPAAPAANKRRGSMIPTTYEDADRLLARDASSLGSAWPRPDHCLLIAAACASPDHAVAAWRRWASSSHAADLNELDIGASRLLGHAAVRLRRLGLRDPILERALTMYRYTWCTNQLRTRAALEVIGALEREGIPVLPLKGLALLCGYYADIGLRPMLDIDLLVPPAQAPSAVRVLTQSGWSPPHLPLHPALRAGHLPPDYSCQLQRASVKLDLHWYVLAQDASATLARPFFAHATRRTLGGASVLCPHATELLLQVCLHGIVNSRVPPLFWAVDAVCLIAAGEIDWQRLVATAAARRLTLPVYDALRYLSHDLDADVPKTALDAFGATTICELESMEHAAMTRRFNESSDPERWSMHHLIRRRREETLGDGSRLGEAKDSPILVREPHADNARAQPPPCDPSPLPPEPLITCLCVTENRPAFVPWLLWNYDRQSWPRRELVIVDSSDPPLALPDRPDVRILHLPPGTPLGRKRNLALDAVRGEAFAWFDDDDWQHPSRLAWLVDRLQRQALGPGVTHCGPNAAWFVDVFGDGCVEFCDPRAALFNGSLFITARTRAYRFAEGQRVAEDVNWLASFDRDARSIPLARNLPPVFFWLCHDTNVANSRRARALHRSPDEVRVALGDDWGDTDRQLAALSERLGGAWRGAPVPKAAPLTGARPRIWVVTPCMNRLAFLRETAPRVLSRPEVGYCLVDYSCPDRCGEWLEAEFGAAVREGRCVVERIVGKTSFNKCEAHNAGAGRAIGEGAEYLVFLDADTVLETGFFDWLLPQLEPKRFLIAARGPDGRDVPSLTGLLAVSAAAFAETDGFDVEFRGWGSEDIEMRLRLHVLHGLSFDDVPLSLMNPIAHDDVLRAAYYEEKNIARSDQRNFSRMMGKLQGWRQTRPFDQAVAARLFYKAPFARSAPSPAYPRRAPATLDPASRQDSARPRGLAPVDPS